MPYPVDWYFQLVCSTWLFREKKLGQERERIVSERAHMVQHRPCNLYIAAPTSTLGKKIRRKIAEQH